MKDSTKNKIFSVFFLLALVVPISLAANATMMNYINTLDSKAKTTFDNGLVMMLYLNDKTLPPDFKGRLSYAKKQGLLPESFNKNENDRLTRGDISLMLARYLKLDGSFLNRIFECRRYSYHLLVYHDLMPAMKSEWDNMSGEELVEVIRLADEYKRKQDK